MNSETYYDCSLDGVNWTTIFEKSRGSAKAAFLRRLDFEVAYTKIMARVNRQYSEPIQAFVPMFNKKDKVVMHTCIEADFHKGKIWTCKSDSYIDKASQEVVFLDGFSGCFLAQYLTIVNI